MTYQELDLLFEDFTDYLYTKGINKYEWRILQDQHSDDALKLLATYSDITFDKVMKSINYLERRSNKSLQVIRFREEEMLIIGISVPPASSVDLLDIESLDRISEFDLGGFKSYRKSQSYAQSREHEIFRLIESGFQVVDSQLYKQLEIVRSSYLN